ncbi:unnamed protein product, partial [Rotaria sp. Silwood2]
MWFSFQQNKFKLNHYLKRLTIKLFYFNSLFILMKNLIVLEYLNVTIHTVRGDGMDDYTRIRNETVTLPRIKHLIFRSLGVTYPLLILFLEQFQKSIEVLKLNLSINDHINSDILEATIISIMPYLREFHFFFQLYYNNIYTNTDINIELNKLISTFCSKSYWTFHPVFCYCEQHFRRFTIFTLSWISIESFPITNEIVNYRLNITTPLKITNIIS